MTTLTITFDADWHVGAGAGIPGDLDAVVRRSSDGLPVVPGRTVTGMWRDGCERVAAALGGGWPEWVQVLFGGRDETRPGTAARAAALSARSAVMPDRQRAVLAAEPNLAAQLFGARPGVKIDRGTGQAVPNMLRRIETARGGLTLTGTYTVEDGGWSGDQRRSAGVLLALGAREVRALGGDRRRGLGECRWEIPVDDAVGAVLAAPSPPYAAAPPAPIAPTTRLETIPTAGMRVVVELLAECIDPLVSATVETDSMIRGRTYLPGGRVLPGVIARARAEGLEVEHLVATGRLVCTPLVPEVDGAAGRPAPLAATVPKGATSPVVNRLLATHDSGATQVPLRHRWVGPVTGPGSPAPALVTAGTEVRPHNAVQDSTQRPTSAVGGLYSIEMIPAGSRLRGRVVLDLPDGDDARFAAALSGMWAMGRSRKDEYGRVLVTAQVVPDNVVTHEPREQVAVWCLTDAVLLDARLAPVTTVDGALGALGELLGVRVVTVPDGPGTVSAAVAFGREEGWHGRWTRPRPTLAVLTAGSVLQLRRADGVAFSTEQLDRLASGIGERRVEGFGEVSLDDPLLRTDQWTPRDLVASGSAAPTPAAPDDALVAALRQSARRTRIEQNAATVARDQLGALATEPGAAGVRAGLRAALALADVTEAIDRFRAQLDRLPDAWSQPARTGLGDLLETDLVWRLLRIDPADRDPTLKPFAVRRVLAHIWAGGTVGRRTEEADHGT